MRISVGKWVKLRLQKFRYAEVPLARVADYGCDPLARAEVAGDLQGGEYICSGGYAGEDAFLAAEFAGCF